MTRFALLFLIGCGGEKPPPSQPASAPVTVAPESPAVLRVLVAGDAIPHRGRLDEPQSLRAALAPLEPLFAKADVAIANYETSTGDPSVFAAHAISLAASADWMAELSHAHIGAIAAANNHACDLGIQGVQRTLHAAKDAKLVAVGADETDPWEPKVLFEKNGRSLCALAWTTFHNVNGPCAHANRIAHAREGSHGEDQVGAAIRNAKKKCTAVIAIAHGGIEYAAQTPGMMSMARVAADAGALAVLVHHPHIVAAPQIIVTKDKRRVPFYPSLGNLVSNQGESWTPDLPAAQHSRKVNANGWTRLGMVADLEIILGDAPRITYGHHLIWTDNGHDKIASRLLDRAADEAIVSKLSKDATGPTPVFSDSCNLQGIDAKPVCQ